MVGLKVAQKPLDSVGHVFGAVLGRLEGWKSFSCTHCQRVGSWLASDWLNKSEQPIRIQVGKLTKLLIMIITSKFLFQEPCLKELYTSGTTLSEKRTESNFFHDFQGGGGPNRIFPLNSLLRGVQFIISYRVVPEV